MMTVHIPVYSSMSSSDISRVPRIFDSTISPFSFTTIANPILLSTARILSQIVIMARQESEIDYAELGEYVYGVSKTSSYRRSADRVTNLRSIMSEVNTSRYPLSSAVRKCLD